MECGKCGAAAPEGALYCPMCGKRLSTQGRTQRRPKAHGNGQGTVFKRGRYYTAMVTLGWRWDETDPDHPVRRRITRSKSGFTSVAKARAYLPTLAGKPEDGKVTTLESLWEVYSKNAMQKLSKTKQDAYRIAHGKLGDLLYRDIKGLDIGALQEAVNQKAKTFYPARDMKTLLSHLYKMAAAQETVKTNLAAYIELPPLDEEEQTPFSQEEQNALWADYAAGNWWTGYLLLMIYSGMMPGELLRARKDMVDLENHIIAGAGLKTKKRKVTPLVLSDAIEPVVANLMERVQGDKLLRMNKDNFYKTYYETLERCGCRRLPPYSCRHTTATALTLKDIPIAIVQEVMRHSKISTTQKYIHVGTGPMRRAVNQLGKTESSGAD